jgi:hypothetical protein
MPVVDFSQFPYYPALTCTDGEHLAYEMLSDGDKESLLPILELSHRRNAESPCATAEMIRRLVGAAPFILDLNKTPAPAAFVPKHPSPEDLDKAAEVAVVQKRYNSELERLLNSANGFAVWREVTAGFPNAVPMIIYADASTQSRQILRQASLLARRDCSLAIRVTAESRDAIIPVISQILSILESEDRLLIVLDAGQGRQRPAERVAFIQESAMQILLEIDRPHWPLVRMVAMSSSFPQTVPDGLQPIDNLDWSIWREVRETCPIFFGDYGAHHRLTPSSTYVPNQWKATVVFPLDETWLSYRHQDARDSAEWVEGSKAILAHKLYGTRLHAWGHDRIKAAARGDIRGVDSARFWHASKINIHIHRQIHFSAANIVDYGDDPGE